MKSELSKKMRAIRIQLKLHTNTEEEKVKLREELNAVKKFSNEKKIDEEISLQK